VWMPDEATNLPDPAAATPAPPAELLVVGRFDERPGYGARRSHGAPSWLLTWTLAGEGRLRQGGVRVVARPGDLVVLGADVDHEYGVAPAADRWTFWWVHFQPRTSWQTWLRPAELGGRMFVVRDLPAAVRERIEAAFQRMHADARWSGVGAPPTPAAEPAVPAMAVPTAARELATGRVEEILLLATAAGERSGEEHDARIQRAEAILAADPAAPHTVRSLAREVALSPSRFAHLFAEETGRTPMQALRDVRLRHAATLLEATNLAVGQVASACGFVSAFHFSRVFRARFGVSPRAYRGDLRR
jgi:AraC family transcriptional regulator, arabinose operon regulatory protein